MCGRTRRRSWAFPLYGCDALRPWYFDGAYPFRALQIHCKRRRGQSALSVTGTGYGRVEIANHAIPTLPQPRRRREMSFPLQTSVAEIMIEYNQLLTAFAEYGECHYWFTKSDHYYAGCSGRSQLEIWTGFTAAGWKTLWADGSHARSRPLVKIKHFPHRGEELPAPSCLLWQKGKKGPVSEGKERLES